MPKIKCNKCRSFEVAVVGYNKELDIITYQCQECLEIWNRLNTDGIRKTIPLSSIRLPECKEVLKERMNHADT